MASIAARSPSQLSSRDWNLGYYGCLGYDFLAFVPCLVLFVLFSFLITVFISSYSSVQQPYATLSKHAVRVLSFSCRLYLSSSRSSFAFNCFVFFAVVISRVAFLLCSRNRYVRTYSAYLDNFGTFVWFVALSATAPFVYL